LSAGCRRGGRTKKIKRYDNEQRTQAEECFHICGRELKPQL
jgi:hypothetical protein